MVYWWRLTITYYQTIPSKHLGIFNQDRRCFHLCFSEGFGANSVCFDCWISHRFWFDRRLRLVKLFLSCRKSSRALRQWFQVGDRRRLRHRCQQMERHQLQGYFLRQIYDSLTEKRWRSRALRIPLQLKVCLWYSFPFLWR